MRCFFWFCVPAFSKYLFWFADSMVMPALSTCDATTICGPMQVFSQAVVTAQQSVAALYTAIFNRAPDQAGLNFWTAQINAGASFCYTGLKNLTVTGNQAFKLGTLNSTLTSIVISRSGSFSDGACTVQRAYQFLRHWARPRR